MACQDISAHCWLAFGLAGCWHQARQPLPNDFRHSFLRIICGLFYTLQLPIWCYGDAVYAKALCLSVCLSVCLSITRPVFCVSDWLIVLIPGNEATRGCGTLSWNGIRYLFLECCPKLRMLLIFLIIFCFGM